MLQGLPAGPVAAAVAALLPACLLWWSGRALGRAPADPALAERLLAHNRRNGYVLGMSIVLVGAAWPRYLYWTLPLLLTARIAAGYPLRRALYAETWSLPAYLLFVARLVLAFLGFWIVLVLMPSVSGGSGARGWLVALALAAVLCVWNAKGSEFAHLLLRARPITDPALAGRFAAVARASGIPQPRFEYVDLGGGAIANAIALPSTQVSSVIFTDTLLARLDPDEAVAICAHEVAHLEHYTRRRLRQIGATNYALIAAGLAAVAYGRAAGTALLSSVVWAGLLALVLVIRARDRQRHETESDLRAVALTGDGEALVRGLVKLYTFARVPRRLATEYEHRATHPSLARRVRAIRKAAGAIAASLPGETRFPSADGKRIVEFADDRLILTDGDTSTHTLSYAGLTELRLDARRSRGIRLVAVERSGREWETPVAGHSLAAIQAALDVVDGRLAEPAGRVFSQQSTRIVAVIAVLLALGTGYSGLLLVSILAIVRPAAPLLAATGAGALMTAAIVLRDRVATMGDPTLAFVALLAGLGIALLGMARASRDQPLPRYVRGFVAAVGACAACAAALSLTGGVDPVRLHLSARSMPAVAVLASAFGAALAFGPGRAVRLGGAAALVIGLGAGILGSISFLDRFGRDPLLLRTAPMAVRTVTTEPVEIVTVPFEGSGLILSPGGEAVAVRSEADENARDSETPTFHIGPRGAALTPVRAYQLLFLNDDEALLLDTPEDGSRLRTVKVTGAGETWRLDLPGVYVLGLSLQAGTRQWSALGWDAQQRLTRVDGVAGTPATRTSTWPGGHRTNAWTMAIAASGEDALVVEGIYNPERFASVQYARALDLLPALRSEATVWRISSGQRVNAGTSRLGPQCIEHGMSDDRITCSIFDGMRTRFVALDLAPATVTPIGSLDGRFAAEGRSAANGWLSGWLDRTPVAVRLATGEAVRLERPRTGWVSDVAATDGVIASLVSNGSSSEVRIYAQPAAK